MNSKLQAFTGKADLTRLAYIAATEPVTEQPDIRRNLQLTDVNIVDIVNAVTDLCSVLNIKRSADHSTTQERCMVGT